MPLTRADFDNPSVANAANPSAFGYHHGAHTHTYFKHMLSMAGPIPNNNPGWLPTRQAAARAAGAPRMYILCIC